MPEDTANPQRLRGRELVIGVTGGIAAYKTAALVSRLVQEGAGVQVVMTAAARRFVGEATFEALTGRRALGEMFGQPEYPLGPHIHLAERAELLCVAPATADFMARAAHGLADDLLSALLLAYRGKVLLAPAMNDNMWRAAAVQRNVSQLQADGYQFVGPDSGWLSCRREGVGRMAEPDEIFSAICRLLSVAPSSGG